MLVRYPNRRVYDFSAHKYVNVQEIRARLLAGAKVICHVTQGDVTTLVLRQLVVSDIQRDTGPTARQLREFIRSYSGSIDNRAADRAVEKTTG